MPAVRALVAVWPAMRVPGCQIAGDVGRAMRTTKILSQKGCCEPANCDWEALGKFS